jgi:arylsulfatase A-like enzyme
MDRRAILEVCLVAFVTFGAAFYWKSSHEGGVAMPRWVPMLGDPLVDWQPDAAAFEADQRILHGELARAPAIWDPPKGADIVVIVLDTVRADHMGVYGYEKGTTPKLDAWGEKGRIYEQMTADGGWTLPSHASLFTGKTIAEHGARGSPLGGPLAYRLADRTPTVAQALRQAGWRTIGIAANRAFLHPMWGLDQGFDIWMCTQLRPDKHRLPYPTADRITEMAKYALKREREAPLFLFLNYMDAHAPWVPRRGYVKDPTTLDRRYLPYFPGWERATTRLLAEQGVVPEVIEGWNEAYDAELRYLDEQVGALLDALPSLGIGPEDYVFVLSDHGEYLGEHDLIEHSKDVYQQVLEVPLLIHGPGYEIGRDPAPIQTHDLATMILAAAGQPPLEGSVRTEDLVVSEEHWARQRDLQNPVFGRRFDRIRRAFRSGPLKLILGSDGTREAYDLSKDPMEQENIAGAPWVPALQERAKEWLKAQKDPKLSSPATDAIDTEALQQLGYVE